MDMFDNRVTATIADLDERIAGLDPEALARVETSATLESDEWFMMGDWASRASMAGILSVDEAQMLHVIHKNFETESLARRVAFMLLMGEVGPVIMAGRA